MTFRRENGRARKIIPETFFDSRFPLARSVWTIVSVRKFARFDRLELALASRDTVDSAGPFSGMTALGVSSSLVDHL